MAWYGSLGIRCPQCRTDHHLVYDDDDIPDSSEPYEFRCPVTNGRVAITGIRAWSDAPMLGVAPAEFIEISKVPRG